MRLNKSIRQAKNMRYIYALVLLVVPMAMFSAYADQDTEDIFASVVVNPSFNIEVDNNYLEFGMVEPGQTVTLKGSTYYNTIKCLSNKGIRYTVKLYILGDVTGPMGNKIDTSYFKWKIYDTDGRGIPVTDWQEFSDKPVTFYTSSLDDEAGREVLIRMQYKLELPASARGGRYNLRAAYIITEENQ